ncbi:MAG TPA: hypothetical protein VD963_08855 [Phycisphaerales bacterium]|nr:hypothetical protein [Phycisphaerales bacterium]
MNAPPRGRRVRRWVVRGLIAVALLLVLAVVLVQLVLWSDYPKQMVLKQLRLETGLRVDAAEVRTTWFSGTRLGGVSLGLALENAPLVLAPSLEVEHRNLPGLLLGLDIGIQRVAIDRPEVTLRRDEAGVWNLVAAIQTIRRTQEAKRPSPGGGGGGLPRIEVAGGVVTAVADGRTVLTTPLEFRGGPEGEAAWAFRATLRDGQAAHGRLVPGGDWEHRVELMLPRLDALLAPFLPAAPEATLAGRWWGAAGPEGLVGTAWLEGSSVAGLPVSGELGLAASGSVIELAPRGVTLELGPAGPVAVTSGAISVDGPDVTATDLRASALGAAIIASGAWDATVAEGSLRAEWTGTLGPAGTALAESGAREPGGPAPGLGGTTPAEAPGTHSGSAEVILAMPRDRDLSLRGNLRSLGAAAGREWALESALEVDGPDWRQISASLRFPILIVSDEAGPIDLGGLGATSRLEWPVVRLTSLVLPHASGTRAVGAANLSTREFLIDFSTQRWEVPRLGAGPIDLAALLSGDADHLDFSQVVARAATWEAEAEGSYFPGRVEPLRTFASVRLLQAAPPDPGPAEPGPELAREEEAPERAPVTGDWEAQVEVVGSIEPVALEVSGAVLGRRVRAGEAAVENLDIPFDGRVGARWATDVATEPFALLGGRWRLRAGYDPDVEAAQASVVAEEVPLDRLVGVAGAPLDVAGAMWADVGLRLPDLDPDKLEVDGAVRVGETTAAGYGIEAGTARVRAAAGRVDLSNLTLTRGGGAVTGSLGFAVRTPHRLVVVLESRDWPLAIEGTRVGLLLDGAVDLDIDLRGRSASGPVSLGLDVSVREEPLGRLDVQAGLAGRTINADHVRAELAGGTLSGRATVPLDNWTASTALLHADALDLSRFAGWVPGQDQLRGIVNGSIDVGPADSPRALEPLRVRVDLAPRDARAGRLELADAHLTLYAGPGRLVLDDSAVGVAGGTLDLWGRLSWHEHKPFIFANVGLTDVEIGQIVHTIDPEARPVAGLLSGRFRAGAYVYQPRRAFGEGQVALREADLGEIPILSDLYGLLGAGASRADQGGRGQASFRLEGDNLHLTRLEYFHRGADVIASGTMENVWALSQSPIRGIAMGKARPLKGSGLPLGADADRLLRAVQSDAVVLEFTGTIDDQRTRTVLFGELKGTVGRAFGAAAGAR